MCVSLVVCTVHVVSREPMTSSHHEGTRRIRRAAAGLLRLSFEPWVRSPVHQQLLDGENDLTIIFRDDVELLCSACESEGERALVVSRPGPASSVFAHANTGGMVA